MKKVLDANRLPKRAPFNSLLLYALALVVWDAHIVLWAVYMVVAASMIGAFMRYLKEEQHVDIFED